MHELHGFIEANHGNICGITALQNGKTVYEDFWHGFKPDDALNVMSVTKSIVSLLTGIAMDKGYIKSIDQRVIEFFPSYTARRGEKTMQNVTLRHLLTMTAPYKYKSEPWTKVCSSDDWTAAALDILGGRAGITGEFKYATLGIQILSGVIANSSGISVTDFANSFLFKPLGIAPRRNAEATTKEAQFDFLMSKLPKENVWFADPKGVSAAGWGLCLSSRDMAHIGQMCLNGGTYGKKRIVSGEWISESTRPRIKLDERFGNMSYGYLWWTPDENKPAYAAIGDGGNVIYVDPEKNAVVTIAATFKPRVFDRIDFIKKHIEPLFD